MTDRHLSSASGRPLRSSSLEGQGQERVQYYYPPIPSIRAPPPARIAYGQHYPEGRVQSSISTESGSSQTSYQQRKTPSPASQWPSPTLERTLVNSDPYYSSQSIQRPGSEPVTRSHYKRSEMVENNSPALAYIRDRRQIEEEDDAEEEDDDDHALWVLVSYQVILVYVHHTNDPLVLALYSRPNPLISKLSLHFYRHMWTDTRVTNTLSS